jgi:alpha-glucosidase (family GH31 glycosyl hydrolase)
VKDQFLLGNDILVAPLLQADKTERTVLFPPGVWEGDDGIQIEGPCQQTIKVPLNRLPWFRKQ